MTVSFKRSLGPQVEEMGSSIAFDQNWRDRIRENRKSHIQRTAQDLSQEIFNFFQRFLEKGRQNGEEVGHILKMQTNAYVQCLREMGEYSFMPVGHPVESVELDEENPSSLNVVFTDRWRDFLEGNIKV